MATGAYGISFGALSVAAGLSLWQTMALSLLLFSGGSQFALVGIVAAGGSGVAAVATSSLLGVRNGLYGLQVCAPARRPRRRRAAAAQLTIDESTAVAVGQPELARQPARLLGHRPGGLRLWNLTTVVGALIGDLLGDPQRYGLDAAAAAAFCALLWPRLRNGETRAVAGAAALAALLIAPHAPAGVPVLVAALAAVVAGLRRPPDPGGRADEPWLTVLLASAIAFGLKLAGHLVPHSWLDGARVARIAAMLPVALLAALVAVQTFTTAGGTFVVDARAGALAVAVVALALRAPFLLVVVLAAATAAGAARPRLGRLARRRATGARRSGGPPGADRGAVLPLLGRAVLALAVLLGQLEVPAPRPRRRAAARSRSAAPSSSPNRRGRRRPAARRPRSVTSGSRITAMPSSTGTSRPSRTSSTPRQPMVAQ